MIKLINGLKDYKFPWPFAFVILFFFLLWQLSPLLQKLLEKPSTPTVTISPTGAGNANGTAIDLRTSTTTIVGDNNKVISNSDSNANK